MSIYSWLIPIFSLVLIVYMFYNLLETLSLVWLIRNKDFYKHRYLTSCGSVSLLSSRLYTSPDFVSYSFLGFFFIFFTLISITNQPAEKKQWSHRYAGVPYRKCIRRVWRGHSSTSHRYTYGNKLCSSFCQSFPMLL